ncbi:retrotransposon protein, putative, ty1-copia subclass [Tanacetum coccineum]
MSGCRYFLSIVDDYSRRVWVHFLIHKNEAFSKFKGVKQLVEKPDRLLDSFWAEATVMAAYLINRSPSTALEKKTPMDLWSGHPMNYEILRIFGCVAYTHVNQGKLKPRAIKCLFLGYPDGVKGSRLWRFLKEGMKMRSKMKGLNNRILTTIFWCVIEQKEQLLYLQGIGMKVRAMEEEMSSLKKNHTWELVDQPPGQKLVSCKWLYKIKEGIKGVQKPRNQLYEQPPGFEEANGQQDDMLIACKSKSEIEYTKGLLRKEFDMERTGPARKDTWIPFESDWRCEAMRKVPYANVEWVLKCTLMVLPTRPILTALRDGRSKCMVEDQGKHVDVETTVPWMQDRPKTLQGSIWRLRKLLRESIWLKGLLIELGVNLRRGRRHINIEINVDLSAGTKPVQLV